MVEQIKAELKAKGLQRQLKVSQSSCLGHCEQGITACLYPANHWMVGLGPDQVPELIELLENGAK
jgi:(2Fe-2S) ferredoxin